MTSLVMIFVVAFLACGIVHFVKRDTARRQAEARELSQTILTGAWLLALAQAVSPAMFAKVYEAFLDYELILFRGVDLPPATQVAFARNFGEVQIHVLSQTYGNKDHPEIYTLSNLDKDGNPSGKHPDRGTLAWHTDGSWRHITGQATIIYGEVVAGSGPAVVNFRGSLDLSS